MTYVKYFNGYAIEANPSANVKFAKTYADAAHDLHKCDLLLARKRENIWKAHAITMYVSAYSKYVLPYTPRNYLSNCSEYANVTNVTQYYEYIGPKYLE